MEDFKIINLTQDSLMNRLFCSFSKKEELDNKLAEIIREYKILYNKIFVLASPESDEYLCTYNIEVEGPTTKILPNTILLHRKKETNTLYTINALNAIIKSKNGGELDGLGTDHLLPGMWRCLRCLPRARRTHLRMLR